MSRGGWVGLTGPFVRGFRRPQPQDIPARSRQQGSEQLITLDEARQAIDLNKLRQAMEAVQVAAGREHPRLWVGFEAPGRWAWSVTAPDACLLDNGQGETWAEAIAVGLAALEVASVAPETCSLCGLPIADCSARQR